MKLANKQNRYSYAFLIFKIRVWPRLHCCKYILHAANMFKTLMYISSNIKSGDTDPYRVNFNSRGLGVGDLSFLRYVSNFTLVGTNRWYYDPLQ